MEQEKSKNGIITISYSLGKIAAFIAIVGFVIGFIAWATRTGDNSAKIPEIQGQVNSIDKRLCSVETAIDYQTKLIESQSKQMGIAVGLLKKK
jgi:hypothetical protein